MKDYLIREFNYDCSICDEVHKIQERKRISKSIIKNTEVEYEQVYYYCSVEDEEFVSSKIMDENLVKARDAYRNSMGLLTSEEIKNIRNYYGLTQKEFSNLLGWGDVTIQRYEKKLIQDETYDNVIRMVWDDPSYALQMLKKHGDKFSQERFQEVKNNIKQIIKVKGNELLKIKEIENFYMDFDMESDLNGFKLLDIEKANNIIGYFAQYINNLYKVKLMKLLWYADFLHFKKYEKSMTGLVYQHLPLGAVPVAYNEIIYLPSIKVIEEYFDNYTAYRIYPNNEVNLSAFTLEELGVLEKVAVFFKNKKTKEVVDYMHNEKAYIETEPGKIIPYSLANEIKDF